MLMYFKLSRYPVLVLLTFLVFFASPLLDASSDRKGSETTEAAASSHLEEDYLIRPRDVLRIHVFRESDLSGIFSVNSQGQIHYPFLGEIKAENKTLDSLKNYLVEALGSDYIKNPQVDVTLAGTPATATVTNPTVSVRSSDNESLVTIFGQIAEPGNYVFTQHLTLVRLIGNAGGFTGSAAKNRIWLVRWSQPTEHRGKMSSQAINMDQIVKGSAEDVMLEAGDLIFVPESYW